jgi:methylamine dehydrogenase accessory protein MauD
VCEALLTDLKSSRTREDSWLEILLASDGDIAAQREFIESHDLKPFRYIVSTALGVSYRVGRLPFAVLIDAGGVLRARGIINSREHLESLFEAKRLGVGSIQEFLEARAKGHLEPLTD